MMIRPEDVTDAMVEVLHEKYDIAGRIGTPTKVAARIAIAAAINASGCVLVPETLIWDLLEALDKVRASRSRGEEDWNSLNAADNQLRDLLDTMDDPKP